ncbi:venom prothrombin activator omicarin-C non-catalytic subunit [Astyanax mexicanus]|uniref:ferroxidase n=1 Tax=Astyanax mexicanus TaxID=7994 RepID=A0A8T2LJQ7_ASTMX|nr:venom prothrombin activator omicarin-C non-catalytic subunit [Astyanax mexicanus]
MRLYSRPEAPCALALLAFLTGCVSAVERKYYIAAVNIDWDYNANGNQRGGPIYRKTVYREYDQHFKQAKTHPSWSGLLGPTLRGEEDDVITVTFRNMADHPCSIHPHGIAYGKQSEGSLYFDNTSDFEKEDDVISPGNEHTYSWEVSPDVVPKATDPPCLTYMYISHQDIVRDYNTGLIGTMLVCKKGNLSDSGDQVHFQQELVLLFGVFDENKSWYSKGGPPTKEHVKYTINGFTNGSVPDLSICAHSKVSWHLLGMSSEQELFSVHFNGHVLQQGGHKVSSVGLISGTATSAQMIAVHDGQWLLSSHISKHLEAGMHGFFTVNTCERFPAPKRQLTIQQSRESQEWTYYIAAEEVIWDYAPNMPENVDGDFRSTYLKQSSERIGKKYKKAVFTQYKDETFKERAENMQRKKEVGILGPVIRAQIRDIITIVFKNKASHPYSIYPHGLTIDKATEGANYPDGGNQSHAVQPGETYTYVWRVIEDDEPLKNDSRCVTRMYHSAVNTPRDIASGLIGPLLICKSQSLNTRNVQLRSDKEQHAMFAVFDENKSWYLDENINTYCDPKKIKKDDPEFYKSNVMHTINGYVYESGQVLGFCNGEIVTWHVSSVGEQDGIQTATFYGHTFELNNREEDILSLFPMTGETISMNMANDGIWLLASLNTHETTKGVRLKFRDVECFRDYYTDNDSAEEDIANTESSFSVWKPKSEAEVMKEKMKPTVIKEVAVDEETDAYADYLGLRTFSNTGKGTNDMEKVDLSFLDHDEGVQLEDNSTFIYSVPALESPVNVTEIQEVEEFVLLDDGNQGEIKSEEHPVEYSISATVLPSNITLELLENSTENVTDEEDQMLNNTRVSFRLTNETVQDSNTTQLETEFTNEDTQDYNSTQEDLSVPMDVSQELNTTQLETEHTNEDAQDYNSTQEDAEFKQDIFQELNTTQLEMDFTIEDAQENNSTQNDSNIQLDTFQELNITQIDSEFSNKDPQGYNSTQEVSKFPIDMSQELNATQLESEFTTEGAPGHNSTQEDSEFQLEMFQELNTTQEESEFANEVPQGYNSTQEDFQELNTTQLESKLKNDDALDINSTLEYSKDSELSEDMKSTNTSQNMTSSDFESLPEHNKTTLQVRKLWNSLEKSSSQSQENTSLSNDTSTVSSSESFESFSNGTWVNGSNGTWVNGSNATGTEVNVLPTEVLVPNSSSEEDISDIQEDQDEVVIYLKNGNNTEAILTNPLDLQGENWSYEGKHKLVPMEISNDIIKYITDEPAGSKTTSDAKEEKKIVLKRVTPLKGFGMKTKKRVDYKPQPRSAMSPRGFSPRGFAPGELTPRGTRPVSSEENLLGKSIIIGVPRTDFNDYEIYVPKQGQEYDFDNIPDHTEEYEYVEYKDPYKKQREVQNFALDSISKYTLQMDGKGKTRTYFITAEEVEWDYAGYGQRREDKSAQNGRPTQFKKVVFREYLDSSFTTPYIRGEVDEHLGILGPVIKAEVDETIIIVFKNLASNPHSLHANGVSYGKNMEGLKYEDDSPYWYRQDDAVQPNETFPYIWTVNAKVGPLQSESDCRIWAYYSGVNPERDIHSGLIGPLMVCRKGTLNENSMDTRDFMLLFMTFDESKSWYYEDNLKNLQKTEKKAARDSEISNNLKFPAINGIIYSLKGLRMYTKQLVKWHLINTGSPKDFSSIHFHGQTFVSKHTRDQRQGVYPLLPGFFATLEMWPSKPGLWLLESEIGNSQQRGMQTLFLVLDNVCGHPLGLISGTVKDSQITASDSRSYWLPSLARLHNTGKYNAWSTTKSGEWIQVDFQRPVVISKVATQGAKQFLTSHYVLNYTISYSTDRKRWIFYKADSKAARKASNREAHEVKENIFFPPIIGRFIRLHPSHSYNFPTVRMEFYGCELDGCSVPLGMQRNVIQDHQITASSVSTSWYSGPWHPWFARLDKQGSVNAWQAKSNDMQPWLQIELKAVKKITGIVTQGAKSLRTEMFVTAYVLEYSEDGNRWIKYTDDEDYEQKIFTGNTDNNGHVKNYIYPPIFSRFIRIIPKRWQNSITMRIELLGCDFE